MNIAYPYSFDATGHTAQTDVLTHIRDMIEQILFTSPGEVARVFSMLMPLWTLYILVMGLRGRQTIDRALAAQFANEDLTAALRASHADAQRRAYEAQSASAAKTTFLANMSHELRTPLNAVLGFSDIIAHQALGPDAMARYSEYAGDIHASGTHLLSLINDLLDIAKDRGQQVESTHRLTPPADRRRPRQSRRGSRARRHRWCQESRACRRCSPTSAFRRILLNLLSNAIKFAGGRRDGGACGPAAAELAAQKCATPVPASRRKSSG